MRHATIVYAQTTNEPCPGEPGAALFPARSPVISSAGAPACTWQVKYRHGYGSSRLPWRAAACCNGQRPASRMYSARAQKCARYMKRQRCARARAPAAATNTHAAVRACAGSKRQEGAAIYTYRGEDHRLYAPVRSAANGSTPAGWPSEVISHRRRLARPPPEREPTDNHADD